MSDQQAILDAADQLGQLIAAHPATQKLESLIKQLEDNTDSQRLMNDLNRHNQTLAEKQAKGEPIEVDDKRRLQELQQDVAMDPILRDMQLAQMDYVDLMRKVDERIGGVGR
ncbi:MAG: YlbF family regulator [Planctomycetota bacterium]